jgi:hypothetical protein
MDESINESQTDCRKKCGFCLSYTDIRVFFKRMNIFDSNFTAVKVYYMFIAHQAQFPGKRRA